MTKRGHVRKLSQEMVSKREHVTLQKAIRDRDCQKEGEYVRKRISQIPVQIRGIVNSGLLQSPMPMLDKSQPSVARKETRLK